MTGFEARSSGIGSDRAVNYDTTTANFLPKRSTPVTSVRDLLFERPKELNLQYKQ